MIRCLSLFSGIGGLDLGLEATGRFQIVAQSEIDPYACRVLAKRWPDVPNLGDVGELENHTIQSLGSIDCITGGFPCQDVSVANRGRDGISGARSGLFFELMRCVGLLRPRYVLLENVPALLARPEWMGAVLGELSQSGFDAEWDCIPAAACGFAHRRDRLFIVAYAKRQQLRKQPGGRGGQGGPSAPFVAVNGSARVLAGRAWPRPKRQRVVEPDVGRVLPDGIPHRMDRLRGLGNAVVPQVATYIAQRILDIEDDRVSQR